MDASPSSASLCPGCGKPIDSLRAGHVAILEGGFRYFHSAECKAQYVEVSSKRISLEALTAEPPSVVPSGVKTAPPPAVVISSVAPSGVREPSFPEPSFPEPSFPEPSVLDAEDEPIEEEPIEEEEHEEAPPEEPAPTTLRSTEELEETEEPPPVALEPVPEPAPRSVAAPVAAAKGLTARLMAVAPIVGIVLGVLAFVISLAGEGGGFLRLPFAFMSAVVLATSVLLKQRDAAEPALLVVVAPVLLAGVGVVVSVTTRDPHADSHAAYLGLAAAAALLVDLLLSRGRRDLEAARARVVAGLGGRVRVVTDRDEEVDASAVKPGEQVVVEAGEVIGVDGIVTAGDADVAPWLDSPVVVTKREGDAVVAGASVVSGRLRITATFTGRDRAWVKLHQSEAARVDVAAPLVVLARRTVERGSPIAALLVGGATYALNGGWPDVIIAASAGAYAVAGLAAVATAALAHGRGHIAAQRRGIVYKDADAFDGAARAEVAVVCSRGTILLGEPEIVAAEAVTGRGVEISMSTRAEDTARVLALAAGAEMASADSGDAASAAIMRALRGRSLRAENLRSAIAHAGLGVTALNASGEKVIVGSRAFLVQEKVSVAIADARVTELEGQGRSVLLVAVGDRLVGLLALQDGLRPGARAAVQRMHDARIEPVLLSGEARDTCETIARALDIEHVRPEILPGERGAEVRALADGGRVVAALGHPSSDDGALGAADVSVAMSAAGAAPGEWAVALASDDVRDAALALTVPRACRERARTAVLVAAGAQGLALLGIAFGVAPPALAPIAAVVAAAAALAVVRDPTASDSR